MVRLGRNHSRQKEPLLQMPQSGIQPGRREEQESDLFGEITVEGGGEREARGAIREVNRLQSHGVLETRIKCQTLFSWREKM